MSRPIGPLQAEVIMVLEVATGTLLVLITWAVGLLLTSALGRWIVVLVQPQVALSTLRRASLWWGFLVIVALTLAMGLLAPLRSAAVAAVVITITVGLALLGHRLRRATRRRAQPSTTPPWSVWALLAALAGSAMYLAFKAIGPATNYDTGLYHLGAIKYAGDYATIPGLATLFFPFGYSNAQFPLAALIGNGPWDGVGYRLLNGFVVLLVITELVLRLASRRYSWGTFVLIVGTAASLVPLVALSDFLVTSPTADTAILLLTLMSSTYLVDFLSERRERGVNASVVAVTVVVMVSMRPTMIFFAVGSGLVVAASIARQRSWARPSRAAWTVIAATLIVIGGLQVLRDRLLSGWLFYPLSIFSFDVPWQADDPVGPRDATLAAARDAYNPDQYSVAHSWSWIPVWLGRLGSQWETYFLLAGILVTGVTCLIARRSSGFPRQPRRLVAAMVPSGSAVLTWFFLSPPSFRFIWGPLFCLVFIPLGAALHALHRAEASPHGVLAGTTRATITGGAIVLVLVTGFSAVARNQADSITEVRSWSLGAVSIPYAVAPIPLPPVVPVTMTSGLVINTPGPESDQCWDNYPLCSFNMGDNIALRGPSIQEGFIRQ